MLLSIITPFFNSVGKCERLLETLAELDAPDVEVILVDDGSADGTSDMLYKFVSSLRVANTLLVQKNRGPGAARNAGLKAAKGSYVWFVDSDDDICLGAIDVVRKFVKDDYDFIDFDYMSRGRRQNSMSVAPGSYVDEAQVRAILLENLGRICTKVIARRFFTQRDITYPELCIYEDSPFVFILPFGFRKFFKAELVGYVHHEDFGSVTRASISPRYFDRLYTAEYGLQKGRALASGAEMTILAEKFLRLYLINTVRNLLGKDCLGNWRLSMRVMRQYRHVASLYRARLDPISRVGTNRRRRVIFRMLWAASFVLPAQNLFFDRLRQNALQRGFNRPRDHWLAAEQFDVLAWDSLASAASGDDRQLHSEPDAI